MPDVIVNIAPRTIVKATLIAVVLIAMVVALRATRNVVADLVIAAAMACLVRPGVLRLARRTHIGVAIFVVYTSLVIGLIALLSLEAGALSSGTNELRRAIPDRLARMQANLPAQNALRRFLVEDDVVTRVRNHIDAIPSRVLFGTATPLRGASQFGVLMLVVSLSAFMISRGPAIFRWFVRSLPSTWQASATTAGRAAYKTGGAYVRRTFVLSGAAGLVAGGLAALCHVPGAAAMGFWAGMWAMIPRFGMVVGGFPLVGLAFGQGTVEGVAALIGMAAIVVVAETERRRWIELHTVIVGPFISLVAVMIGMEIDRWTGALVVMIAASFIVAGIEARSVNVDNLLPAELPPTSLTNEDQAVAQVPETPDRTTIDIDTKSLVLVAGFAFSVVVIVVFTREIPTSLARLAVAVFIALALNPLVDLVQRWLGGRRALALSIVVAVSIAIVVAFTLYAVPRAVQQGRNVGPEAKTVVSKLDDAPIVGARVRHAHLDTRIRQSLDDIPHLLTAHRQTLSSAASSAGESLLAASWTVLLAFAALLDGPALGRKVDLMMPSARRPGAQRLGDMTYESVGRSAAGAALSAVLQAAVVMVIALAFGVPLAPLLGANAALWSFVPQVGGLFAGLPLFVFALTQGLGTAVICGLLYIIYMVTNNHLLHPIIVGRAVRVSPLASLVAVLVGVSLAGFVGGLLATPVVGVLHSLVTFRGNDTS